MPQSDEPPQEPQADQPQADQPQADVPEAGGPAIDLPETAAQVGRALQSAAYVVIGMSLLVLQRAQVQRVELQKQIDAYLASVREQDLTATAAEELEVRMEAARVQVSAIVRELDGQVGPARRQIEEQVDRFEAALPDQARDLLSVFRKVARRSEQDLRAAFGLDDPGEGEGAADPQA